MIRTSSPHLFALLLSAAPLALADELLISKTLDSDDGVCNVDCSLREALNFANAQPGPHHIVLPPGTYTLPASPAFTEGLPITGDVTIIGSGQDTTILDGAQRSRLFTVSESGRLKLARLSLVNGSSPTPGGAILNHGQTLLIQVGLRDNRVQVPATAPEGDLSQGGALANFGDMAMQGVRFENNGVYAWNRSPAARGGAIFNAARLIVRDGAFLANMATSAGAEEGWGGALYNLGVADIARSAFIGNEVKVWGFGAAILNLGVLQLSNSTLSANYSFERSVALVNGPDPDWPEHFPEPGLVPVRMQLNNVTIAENYNGGLLNYSNARVYNSVIAGNYFEPESGWRLPYNCQNNGNLFTQGLLLGHSQHHSSCESNLLFDDALTFTEVLAPLTTPAKAPPLHPLLEGSPAIDAGIGDCPALDQRQVPRPQDGNADGIPGCDLGAYEVEGR